MTATSVTLPDNVEGVTITSGASDVSATGNALGNTLSGYDDNKTLSGLGGNDTFYGRGANDTLIGGAGKDSFVFTTIKGTGDDDTITDFTPGKDMILLDSSVFVSLDPGALPDDAFIANGAGQSTDGQDRIIYDTDDGTLSDDPDGTGIAPRIVIAFVDPHLAITAADVFVL